MWGFLEYRGGHHEYLGGYLEYREGHHDARGDIMSTVGVLSTWGKIFYYLSTPMVLNTPTVLIISPRAS